jgi:hypothetical protein
MPGELNSSRSEVSPSSRDTRLTTSSFGIFLGERRDRRLGAARRA